MATATKTVTRYRSRPKKKSRRRAKFTLPLAITVPIATLGVSTVTNAIKTNPTNAMAILGKQLTGYDSRDRQFHMDGLKTGLFPIVAGLLAHKIAGVLGVNRALGRAKVPWIRI